MPGPGGLPTTLAGFLSGSNNPLLGPVTGGGIASIPGYLSTGTVTSLSPITGAFSSVPQLYFTVPITNNNPTLYRLRIVSQTIASKGASAVADATYIFPLTPSSIQYQYQAMNAYYDVFGANVSTGVQRIVDQYGNALPIISISGTTGFQYHSADGFRWSGKDSMALLLQLIQNYAITVQSAITSSTTSQPVSIPIMQFDDSFLGDSFYVIPLGVQSNAMDNSRPLLQNYSLNFVVTQILSAATPAAADSLTQAITQVRALLTGGAQVFLQAVINNISATISNLF